MLISLSFDLKHVFRADTRH